MKSTNLIAFVVAITIGSLIVTGCTYGPETKKKSALDYLDRKNYEQVGNAMGVPVIERKQRDTSIEGEAFASGTMPVKFQDLVLLKDGVEVAKTSTSYNGAFRFLGDFPDGKYIVRIVSDKYSGETVLRVKGYEVKGVEINAEPVQR